MLLTKIHRQVTFWANPAPIRGPKTVPSAHVAESLAIQSPLNSSGTRSVMTTSERAMIPPPPTPWMVRPRSRTVKSSARPPTREPAKKMAEAR